MGTPVDLKSISIAAPKRLLIRGNIAIEPGRYLGEMKRLAVFSRGELEWSEPEYVIELIAGKFIVALDGAGDKGSEVEHIKQVGAEADVAPLIAFPGLDDQMKDAEKDVGKPKRKVRIMEEEARGKEGVFLKPDIDKDDRDDRHGKQF